MKIDILSLFPEMFEGFLNTSIIKRAIDKEVVDIKIHNFREFTQDKHKHVDDYPYGGGQGMVLMCQPIIDCLKTLTTDDSLVILASASQAIIYGFNVRPDAKVRNKAEEENVEIRLHNVIYKMVEEIETAMKGMLAPEYHEVITGQAEIRQVIKASKIGNIAGCYVTDGSIKRNCGIRLIRDGIVVYEGKLASLRRFKDDVKEVNAGFECGLNIENYNDIKEGDIIEGYVMEEVEKK